MTLFEENYILITIRLLKDKLFYDFLLGSPFPFNP
jgi:hypothetical protein